MPLSLPQVRERYPLSLFFVTAHSKEVTREVASAERPLEARGKRVGGQGEKRTHLAVAKRVVRKAMKEKELSAFLQCT